MTAVRDSDPEPSPSPTAEEGAHADGRPDGSDIGSRALDGVVTYRRSNVRAAIGYSGEVRRFSDPRAAGWVENTYTEAAGVLDPRGAIRFARAGERDSFRLAPIAGNGAVWVEIRVPSGLEGPRFVPPETFAGRLVRFRYAGLGYTALATVVRKETATVVPNDAWLLVDGGSPRSFRWALALTLLLAGFAGWNLVGVARVLARVREPAPR